MVPNRDVVAKLIDPTTIGGCPGTRTSVDLEWVILSRRIGWEVGITFAVAVHRTIQIACSVVPASPRRSMCARADNKPRGVASPWPQHTIRRTDRRNLDIN